jgi:alpha,alpha-trehalase
MSEHHTFTAPMHCSGISTETWTRLRLHISEMWPALTRDMKHAVEAASDPKTECGSPCVSIYVSGREYHEHVSRRLEKILSPRDYARIRLLPLPGAPEHITEHGLLYLPDRYVVPGGRFNELYGWDSYFIALGLLRDGRTGLARSVADQCLYEVEHYGSVLNCNRTYCLTRSQPPFLSRLVLAVHEAAGDFAWLRSTLPLLEQYHAYWMTPPHFIAATDLSRYHALGEGPAPEVVHGEKDASGRSHYERVCDALRDLSPQEPWMERVYDRAAHRLTRDGYGNDRTVRESGFDLTNRFGFCGLQARHYLPVCLNTLLWMMEKDIAAIRRVLECSAESIAHWEHRAEERARQMHTRFWDEPAGLFHDWHLERQQRSDYAYATTFMPLWAGWATPEQAKSVARRLPEFLAPGGLLASLTTTGCQWDAPFTWAPLVFMASRGLAAYGFAAEAADVACRFVALAVTEFERTGLLFEKYDAVVRTAEVAGKIHFGYPTNETGFGWTNGVLAELMSEMPPSAADDSGRGRSESGEE